MFALLVVLCTSHVPAQCDRMELRTFNDRGECWAAGNALPERMRGLRVQEFDCEPQDPRR